MEIQQHAHLRIRCPKCLKLYSVDTAGIQDSRPKFQCRDCHEKFWITTALSPNDVEEIMGFPLEWLESDKPAQVLVDRIYSCPKCTEPYTAAQNQCSKCGLIFAKYIEKVAAKNLAPASNEFDGISAPATVKAAWDDVIEQFDKFDVHQKFIYSAQVENCLEYAAKQYALILEACPTDELALRAQKQIEAIESVRFETRSRGSRPHAGPNIFETLELEIRKLRFPSLILLCSGIVITMGVLLPNERNLVGIGSSILFLILALRYYFRLI